MLKVIMGVGVPGSGKTTYLKPFSEKYSYTYICPDDIRKELSNDPKDQSKNKEAWEEAHRRVAQSLKDKKTVVLDATFAKDFERKDFIKFVREQGAEKVQGVFIDVPFEISSERNNNRDRVVPEHAMQRMNRMLEVNPPRVSDGFDSVFRVDEYQKIISLEGGDDRASELKTRFK